MNFRICSGDYKAPIAKVCIGKNEIKTISSEIDAVSELSLVYLKDKTEFSIELYNPNSFTVVAKISFNGKNCNGSGIILRPAERIFVERYLDSDNKFIFSTYEVESNDDEVRKAIEDNGKIEISFYKEKNAMYFYDDGLRINIPWGTTPLRNVPWVETTYSYNTYGSASDAASLHSKGCCNGDCDGINGAWSSANYALGIEPNNCKIETGRIEKGKKSNQKFENRDIDIEYMPFFKSTIKILPESQKMYSSKDIMSIRTYCPECGRKLKSTYKYCPFCGTKLSN
jgi:hypothetical protein